MKGPPYKGASPLIAVFYLIAVLNWPILAQPCPERLDERQEEQLIEARVAAAGLPDAGAVAAVGYFHSGTFNREASGLNALTRRGGILDPTRILVASSSHFGAPEGNLDGSESTVLSLDPEGDPLTIPPDFAAKGDTQGALHGRVQILTAASLGLVNQKKSAWQALNKPSAIMIDSASGSLWVAQRPRGSVRADRRPICWPGAEDAEHALAEGVCVPALAIAPLGASPATGKTETFAVVTTHGEITRTPLGEEAQRFTPAWRIPSLRRGVARTGMLFNWFREPVIYVSDPAHDAVLTFRPAASGDSFEAGPSITARELHDPVDLTPARREVADAIYSSSTSLAAGSDFYVANRGDGSVLRMRQDGCVLAVRRVVLPGGHQLGGGRLNGIAVSPDARRLWLTVNGTIPGQPAVSGAILDMPAFGPSSFRPRGILLPQTVAQGSDLFNTSFTPETGLGPVFNARSCAECHQQPKVGGMGPGGLAVVQRIGGVGDGSFDLDHGSGTSVARARSIAEFGIPCRLQTGPPASAHIISRRNTPPLFGLGLIEAIPDSVLEAQAAQRGPQTGRVNIAADAQGKLHIGRFGWKANTASLEQFVAEAFRDELGMSNPLAPENLLPEAADCAPALQKPAGIGRERIQAVTAFISSLPAPVSAAQQDPIGRILFSAMGCAACHTPALAGAAGEVPLYSDLLLHDMGSGLDDGINQGAARGSDWRTTPLWGLGMRSRFLHDGRAATVREAILAHDGDGRTSMMSFLGLPRTGQDALLTFLLGL